MKKVLFVKLCKKSIATFMALLMFLSVAVVTPALSVNAYADVINALEEHNLQNSIRGEDPGDTYEPGVYMVFPTPPDTTLNMHANPDASSAVISVLDIYDFVEVVEVSGYWGKTTYDVTTGWIDLTQTIMSAVVNTDSDPLYDPGYYGATDDTFLYEEKDIYSAVLAEIPAFEIVYVSYCAGEWGEVTYGGETGWVNLNDFTEAPDTDLTSDSDTTPILEPGIYEVAAFSTNLISLYSSPSAASTILTQIPNYTQLLITEIAGTYGKTTYFGKTGWVSMIFLRKVTYDDSPFKPGLYGATDDTYLFESASLSSVVLATIPAFEYVEVTECSGNWGKTTYDGKTGWVSLFDFVEVPDIVTDTETEIDTNTESDTDDSDDTETDSGEETFTVSNSDGLPVPIYASDNTSDIIVGYIPDGTTVPVYMEFDNWLFVGYEGVTGWIERYPGSDNDGTPKYGDLNNDSKVTMEDVVLYQKVVAKILTFTTHGMLTADVDANNDYNMSDIVLIQRYIAQLITRFPADSEDVIFG